MIRRIRLALLILVAVVFQTTVFTHLRVWGVAPEVGLVAVLAIAYEHGPETGAVFGFVMGLAVDLFLTTPVGLSALSYALTGYGVGIVQGGMIRSPRRVSPVIGGLGGFIGGLVFITVGAMIGESGFLSFASLKTIAIAAAYDAVIAPLVFPAARWAAHDPHAAHEWSIGRR